MGERVHLALVCDVKLVAALSDAATTAVARRDDAPLRAFWDTQRDDREQLLDAFRTPLAASEVAAACGALVALARSTLAATPVVQGFCAQASNLRLDARPVSKSAQDRLISHAVRISRLCEIGAPDEILLRDVIYARAALEALDTGDYHARARAAGAAPEPFDSELVERCLDLCRVPGLDQSVGLQDHLAHTFVEGQPLVKFPWVEVDADPSDELLSRTVERFGVYSSAAANELHEEDWLRFCGSFTNYTRPFWGHGDVLQLAARSIDERLSALTSDEPSDPIDPWDALTPEEAQRAVAALHGFRQTLLQAAERGLAVVEWMVKW